jgi:hypothetical protein
VHLEEYQKMAQDGNYEHGRDGQVLIRPVYPGLLRKDMESEIVWD